MKKKWKGTSLLLAGCAALLLSPVSLTAWGTESPPAATATAVSGVNLQVDERHTTTAATLPDTQAIQEAAPAPAPPPPGGTPSTAPGGASPQTNAGNAPSMEASDPAMDLEGQIGQWIEALSREKGFEAWPKARRDVYPLGPGTHSWVVILRDGSQEIGYMIISATEQGGYSLTEYGTGSKPLFSMDTLYQSLIQLGLIPAMDHSSDASKKEQALSRFKPERTYIKPLQAIWQLTDDTGSLRYLDAKTGEELPDIGDWLKISEHTSSAPSTSASSGTPNEAIVETAAWEPFDPFERTSWLKGNPLPETGFEEWRRFVTQPDTRTTFKSKWYGGLALYPLAVSGYQIWPENRPYISIEHEGPRYVSFSDAEQLGQFIP